MTYTPARTSRSTRFVAAAAFTGLAALIASPVLAKTVKTVPVASQDMSQSEDSDLRLALDKVDLDIESGKLDEASALIEKLEAKYPNNPDVLAAAADLSDQRQSTRQQAFASPCAPNSIEPLNMDILQRAHMASSESGFACGGYNRRITPQSLEQISSLTGQVAVLSPGVSIDADLENDHINTYMPFTRTNGADASFYGDRQQGTVMLQKTFANHDQAAISVFGDNDNAGGGAQYVVKDHWGGTSLQANYNQPDWDYVETMVENGTKSSVRLERQQIFTPNLTAVLSGGYSMYSLDRLTDAATAPGWNFDLDYSHPIHFSSQGANGNSWLGNEMTVGAHYGVEAEYFDYVNRKNLSATDNFNPLPATSYEVHSFTVSAGKSIMSNIDAEIEGGYGVERLTGNSGPVYGGALTYTPIQHLGVDVHASRTLLGGQNNGQKEDIAGASLKWVW